MSAQLDFDAAPPAPSAWDWARAKWPGRVVVRVIHVPTRKQAFAVLEREAGFLIDGSTHYVESPLLDVDDEAALLAECDREWNAQPGH